MAKKNLNMTTIDEASVNHLSAYHFAMLSIDSLKATAKAATKAKREELASVLEKRELALSVLDKNAPDYISKRDAIIAKFDVAPINRELDAISEKLKADCEPHKANQIQALNALLPENIFYSYARGIVARSFNSIGSVVVGKKTINVTKSFIDMCDDFLTSMGIEIPSDRAMNQFTDYVKVFIGAKKDAKTDDYITYMTEKQFNELFLLTMFQLLKDKKAVSFNEDGTLTKIDYTESQEEVTQEPQAESTQKQEPKKSVSKMNSNELKYELDCLGVKYPESAKKQELKELVYNARKTA